MLKKGCMFSLLVTCTSFALASDIPPTANHSGKSSDVNVKVTGNPIADSVQLVNPNGTNDALRGATPTATKPGLRPGQVLLPPPGWIPSYNSGLRDDPCAGSLYSQYADAEYTAFGNGKSSFWGYSYYVVDNLSLGSNSSVTGFVMMDAVYNFGNSGNEAIDSADWSIWGDAGGSPGGVLAGEIGLASFTYVATGNSLFNFYPLYDLTVTFSTSQNVLAGSYYINARPNWSLEAFHYWNASNTGDGVSAWQSLDDGGSFVELSSYGYSDTDMAYCVFGSVSNDVWGACCTQGDAICGIMSKSDCNAAGGDYRGDNVSCAPNPCPNAPGACCMADGTCEFVTSSQCSTDGGTFEGGGITCKAFHCPLPDFCADSLFNQFGFDGVNGLSAQDSGGIGYVDARTADNANMTGSVDMTGAVWQTIDRSDNAGDVSGVDYAIYFPTGAGSPGAGIQSASNVAYDVRLTDGTILFGSHVYVYKVTFASAAKAVAGSYMFDLRPVITNYWQSYWLTAPDDGNQGWFKSAFFGYASWTKVQSLLGSPMGFSFCILGNVSNTPYGACCTQNESVCSVGSKADCDAAGGDYKGDGSSCADSPCPNTPGACCNPNDGSCTDVSKTECDNSGGNFQGGGTDCADTICPPPDFCADSVYTQYANGNMGAYGNGKSSFWGYSYYVADDLTLGSNTNATGLVIEDAVYDFGNSGNDAIDSADWYIYAVAGGGGPGATLGSETGLASFNYLATGDKLFGFYPLFEMRVLFTATQKVPAGTYYVEARPEWSAEAFHYWNATNIGGGNPAYQRLGDTGSWNNVGLDMAYCILGSTTNDVWGACCTQNESVCSVGTKSDCDGMGGDYKGDNTSCSPSPCTNQPGACCNPNDGSCTDVNKGECDNSGGNFQGGGTDCQHTICPPPDFCADSLYSQYHNGNISGYGNGKSSYFNYSYWVADDVTLSSNTKMTALVIEDAIYDFGNSGNDVIDSAGWAIFGDNGGAPGGQLNGENGLASFNYLPTGDKLFNFYPLFEFRVTFSASANLLAGTYFVDARPEWSELAFHYWNATDTGGGNPAYQRLGDSGTWNNTGQNMAFCVLGTTTNDVWGACCTQDETVCGIGSKNDCSSQGGDYKGDNTSCAPNPCPNAPGACCLESGACEFVTPAQCKTDSGNFQGGGIDCGSANCPLPSPCAGEGSVLFDNGTTDKKNGLFSAGGYWDVWSADDFNLSGTSTVTGFNWFEMHVTYADCNLADYFIALDDAGGGPGTTVDSASGLTNTQTDTGTQLFGYIELYHQSISGLSTNLSAATYWVGLRLESQLGYGTYWATAPVTGNAGYFKGAQFGYPNWVPDNTQFGYDSDFSFCVVGPANPCAGIVLGDSNGDGAVTFDDIDCFVAAMVDQATWADCGTSYPPGAYVCANDTNGDGLVNFDDIDSFVSCLIDNGCP